VTSTPLDVQVAPSQYCHITESPAASGQFVLPLGVTLSHAALDV